jgi:glycosyltransferase involved in cell wall biosynthesis
MKIFIDVTSSCTSVQNTGMQRMTRKIFTELSKRAPVTPIYWNRIGRFYQRLGAVEHKLLVRPFDIHSRPTGRPEIRGENPIAELRRFASLSRFDFASSLTENDIFMSPDSHHDSRRKRLPGLIRTTGARSLAIFHDAARLRLSSLYGIREQRYREYIESLAAFEHVVCISEEARDDLLQLWHQCGCRPTSVTVEPWPAEMQDAGSETDESAPSSLIVCVGSLDPRKNHFALILAARNLWREGLDFELHLIGRATKFSRRKIMSEIRYLQSEGRPIQWLRHVDDETLLREYRDCRFTVYPSLMEGYGLPIVESLLHGKPCVCGGNGALGEVARGGGCFIVDQTNVDALAHGMRRLLLDRELYARLCEEARARKFRSWSDYIEKLLKLFQTMTRPAAVTQRHPRVTLKSVDHGDGF